MIAVFIIIAAPFVFAITLGFAAHASIRREEKS